MPEAPSASQGAAELTIWTDIYTRVSIRPLARDVHSKIPKEEQ